MARKQTTFDDFIACAEALVASGRTTPRQLAIEGGSAGGLLMGAVVNQRPDLFCAVVAQVPVRRRRDDHARRDHAAHGRRVHRMGQPEDRRAVRLDARLQPVRQPEARAYPAMLVRTGLNDTQVAYWEPAKYVARLRTLKTDDRPLSSGSTSRSATAAPRAASTALREIAEDDAFVLVELGVAA